MQESLINQQPYPPYASLILRGIDLNPDEVTRNLGIDPQKSFRRGDKRKDNKEWPHGYWAIESSEQVKSLDPVVHISWIVDILTPMQQNLKEIAEDHSIDIELSCFWVMSSSNERLFFSPELLRQIANLNIKVEISIYSP